MTFQQLRQKHKQFIYEGFNVNQEKNNLKITFDFLLSPNIRFQPQIILPLVKWEPQFEVLVFNLGMIELLSYWKATCSPEIVIRAGYLNQDQIKFWEKLLIKGLGEFFYTNKIDFTQDGLVTFKVHSHIRRGLIAQGSGKIVNKQLQDRDLVLVGGGKDSAVTLEMVKNSERDFNCLMLNPTKAALNISKISGCKNPTLIKRIIDPKLIALNNKGYLNGHTPFSAYLAFLSTFAAHLYDYKNIVVSNEVSSNEGNMQFHNQIINHQYSKSFEFEKDFRKYSQRYLSSQSFYYSFLRNLNELEIARKFSKLDKYLQSFRSCNRGSKMGGVWCGTCSKCLFSYLILYPFLGEKIKHIFGKDLLDDENLSPIMEELLQIPGKFKPFECVGTKAEIAYAILLVILRLKGRNLPKLLEKFKNQISILILGMGREGQITYQLLSKILPKKVISIADQKRDGKNYLDKMKDVDIIIKSPGIPYFPEIKNVKKAGKVITSATQIFFDIFRGKIIGVTGTKGKSTTASLIYEVLKNADFDVHLVGNIGKPALELLDELDEDSIVVYELSSFQLEDLRSSPHIAVITNIYPEHLDHHGSFENYKKSKQNILKYQTKKDILIMNKDGATTTKIIGKIFKIPSQKINQAIKNFKPLPHRLEFVGQFKGIKFYNDSLATIPQATIRALDTLGDDVETLIAGGFDRGIDYAILSQAINKSKIKNLILFPDTGKKIAKGIIDKINKFDVKDMKEAVKIAFKKTSQGKIVLLSPASASFNLFKDYEDRGNQFKGFVSHY